MKRYHFQGESVGDCVPEGQEAALPSHTAHFDTHTLALCQTAVESPGGSCKHTKVCTTLLRNKRGEERRETRRVSSLKPQPGNEVFGW